MNAEKHHHEGAKCLVEVYNYKTRKSDFLSAEIISFVSALDRPYRINVKTSDGRTFTQCAPECVIQQSNLTK
jgi:hypothetical protein